MKRILPFLYIFLLISCSRPKPAIVFMTDFGLKDGAVSAMKGVVMSEDPELKLHDLTHEIPPYNIWEAAYRLDQTATYWPKGTVFVAVVDPGVGTNRKSVVMRSRSGHYFVTPDNGTLTLVAASLGIESVREIDEAVNRRKHTSESYTFHGRDVYAYTAARLASGKIAFGEVGRKLPDSVVRLPFTTAQVAGDSITGGIPVLDVEYGNVWTNIPDSLLLHFAQEKGMLLHVEIYKEGKSKYSDTMRLVDTFGDVPPGTTLAYKNSLRNLSFGINQGNFADSFGVQNGQGWKVVVRKR